MLTGFSHVQLVVRDVEASAAWWATVLDLERFATGEIPGGRYVALRHRTLGLVVGLQSAPDGATPASSQLDHLSFGVADRASLESHRERLLAAGIGAGPVFDEAVSHNVRLHDPDGLCVELAAPRARPSR